MTREEVEDIIYDIDELGEDLTLWEIDFISGLIDNPPAVYSDKQIEIIERIYEQRV